MKKTIKLFCTLLVLTLCTRSFAGSRGQVQDTMTCLLIKGKIKNAAEGPDRNCLVELINSSGVVESTLLEGKKNFRFRLQRDSYYAIRISKPGYVTKLISVNTSFPGDVMDVLEFAFTTELLKEELSERLNRDALDFPIAIIHFDFSSEDFIYNKAYTDNIKREIYTVGSRNERVLASADLD